MATAITDDPLTGSSVTPGTVAYMSPEQARAEELDARTDLFSFGAVLYEMATGTMPFKGNTSAVLFDGILNCAPISAVKLNPGVPTEVERIINKALEKDREVRYQTGSDLRADLHRLKRHSDFGRRVSIGSVLPETKTSARFFRWSASQPPHWQWSYSDSESGGITRTEQSLGQYSNVP